MKPKQIIEKLGIQKGVKGEKKQKEFFQLLVNELMESYNGFGLGEADSEQHFNAAIKVLKLKWDAISKRIDFGLSDGLWNFFFATEVIKLKKQCCPTWAARQAEEHEKYKNRQRRRGNFDVDDEPEVDDDKVVDDDGGYDEPDARDYDLEDIG